MKEIQITRGYVAIVDDEDYERVAAHKWNAMVVRRNDGSARVYAMRVIRKPDGGRTTVYLHRVIMGAPVGMDIDHVNGDGLDNSRSNLRACTRSENMRNRRPQGGASKYKGIHWHKRDSKWRAQIVVNGRSRHLGLFSSEVDAACAYNVAATKLFGEFALLNNINGGS